MGSKDKKRWGRKDWEVPLRGVMYTPVYFRVMTEGGTVGGLI